jgi:hypothetical protein
MISLFFAGILLDTRLPSETQEQQLLKGPGGSRGPVRLLNKNQNLDTDLIFVFFSIYLDFYIRHIQNEWRSLSNQM